jgi:bifunctional DNA-binding transcriptional regulator/antitoxin component of YhaV-PrlF toxin-antitoxin module
LPHDKLFSGRYHKVGGTYGVTLPVNARKVLGWIPGSYTMIEVIGQGENAVVCIRILTPAMMRPGARPSTIAPPGMANNA